MGSPEAAAPSAATPPPMWLCRDCGLDLHGGPDAPTCPVCSGGLPPAPLPAVALPPPAPLDIGPAPGETDPTSFCGHSAPAGHDPGQAQPSARPSEERGRNTEGALQGHHAGTLERPEGEVPLRAAEEADVVHRGTVRIAGVDYNAFGPEERTRLNAALAELWPALGGSSDDRFELAEGSILLRIYARKTLDSLVLRRFLAAVASLLEARRSSGDPRWAAAVPPVWQGEEAAAEAAHSAAPGPAAPPAPTAPAVAEQPEADAPAAGAEPSAVPPVSAAQEAAECQTADPQAALGETSVPAAQLPPSPEPEAAPAPGLPEASASSPAPARGQPARRRRRAQHSRRPQPQGRPQQPEAAPTTTTAGAAVTAARPSAALVAAAESSVSTAGDATPGDDTVVPASGARTGEGSLPSPQLGGACARRVRKRRRALQRREGPAPSLRDFNYDELRPLRVALNLHISGRNNHSRREMVHLLEEYYGSDLAAAVASRTWLAAEPGSAPLLVESQVREPTPSNGDARPEPGHYPAAPQPASMDAAAPALLPLPSAASGEQGSLPEGSPSGPEGLNDFYFGHQWLQDAYHLDAVRVEEELGLRFCSLRRLPKTLVLAVAEKLDGALEALLSPGFSAGGAAALWALLPRLRLGAVLGPNPALRAARAPRQRGIRTVLRERLGRLAAGDRPGLLEDSRARPPLNRSVTTIHPNQRAGLVLVKWLAWFGQDKSGKRLRALL